MYFTTIFQFAAFAVAATAAALPTTPLTTREAVCGVWYDSYLGPGSAGDVYGTGQCQQIKKDGEGPDDQSTYTFLMKGACIHCDFYRYDMKDLTIVARSAFPYKEALVDT